MRCTRVLFALGVGCATPSPGTTTPPSTATVAATTRPPVMGFFVTSTSPGDGANLGGLAGADRHCQQLAAAAGAGGRSWRAYLSAPATADTPATHARDRIGTGPWRNARGIVVARDVEELHGDHNRIDRHTALSERGEPIPGVDWVTGDAGAHDILTGSLADGRLPGGGDDQTCGGWTRNDAGSAWVGHHDRQGGGTRPISWSSAHRTRGCSAAALAQAGSRGLFYCFAADPPPGGDAALAATGWIEDDVPRALAEAQRTGATLVVHVRVPWNPASRYLEGSGEIEAGLAAVRVPIVRVRLDLDRARNAAFFAAHPLASEQGAILVLEPQRERETARHEGIAGRALIARLVEDGARAASARTADELALVEADAAVAAHAHARATAAYLHLLERAAPTWPSYGRVAEALVASALAAKDHATCARAAIDAVRRLPGADPLVPVIANLGLSCALDPAPDAKPAAAAAVAALVPLVERAAATPALIFDLRGAPGFENLIAAAADRSEAAAALADRWFAAARELAASKEWLVRTAAAHVLTDRALHARHCREALRILADLERREPEEYTYPHVVAHCHDALGDRAAGFEARLRAYAKQPHGRTKLLGLYYLGSRLTKLDGRAGTALLMLSSAEALATVPGTMPIAPYADVTVEKIREARDAAERRLRAAPASGG